MKVLLIAADCLLSDAVRQEPSELEWSTLEPELLTDDDAVTRAVQGVGAILHLGAISHEQSIDAGRRLDLDTRGTYMLLKAAVDAGIRRFVYASTLDVFQSYPEDVYITEQWRPRPTDDPSQMTPYLGEMVCREFARDRAIGITCVRLGTLVDAPDQSRNVAAPDRIDIADAARACHAALTRDESAALNWVRRWSVYHIVGDHENPRFLRDRVEAFWQDRLGFEPATAFKTANDTASVVARDAETHDATPAPRPRKVLVLGASGNIAPHIIPDLAGSYDLRYADITPMPDGTAVTHVDVTDYEAVLEAARGMDAIMNYTVIREDRDGAFFVNTIGAWNVMRAAAELGIRKVLHTGPQCVRMAYDHDFDIKDVPQAPGTWKYGLSKMLSYEICRIYARVYGIQTICFVFCHLGPRPERRKTTHDFPTMSIIYEDLARACRLALDIESVPDAYQEFVMFSYEGHGKYTLDKARRILGFEPLEKWESYYKRPVNSSPS